MTESDESLRARIIATIPDEYVPPGLLTATGDELDDAARYFCIEPRRKDLPVPTITITDGPTMSRIVEESTARLDAALAEGQAAKELVRDLEMLLRKSGGFAWPTDQATLRRARSWLIEWGML